MNIFFLTCSSSGFLSFWNFNISHFTLYPLNWLIIPFILNVGLIFSSIIKTFFLTQCTIKKKKTLFRFYSDILYIHTRIFFHIRFPLKLTHTLQNMQKFSFTSKFFYSSVLKNVTRLLKTQDISAFCPKWPSRLTNTQKNAPNIRCTRLLLTYQVLLVRILNHGIITCKITFLKEMWNCCEALSGCKRIRFFSRLAPTPRFEPLSFGLSRRNQLLLLFLLL